MTGFIGSLAAFRTAVLVLVFAGIFSTPAMGQASLDVTVTNSPEDPVPVRPLERPYVVRVRVSNTGSAEKCQVVPVPRGTRIVLETVAVDVFTGAQGVPDAYVMTTLAIPNGFVLNRSLMIPLTLRGSATYAGHLRTHVISGPLTVGEGTVTFSLCTSELTSADGFLIGYLLPL